MPLYYEYTLLFLQIFYLYKIGEQLSINVISTFNIKEEYMNKLYEKLNIARLHFLGCLKNINSNNKGMGVIEIVLIILVLVGLVIIFRNQITAIITNVFSKVTKAINGF